MKDLKLILQAIFVAFSANLQASDLKSEIEEFLPDYSMPTYYEYQRLGYNDSCNFGKLLINEKLCPILTNLINKTSVKNKFKHQIETNLQILDDSTSGITINWHKKKASLTLDPRLLIRPQDDLLALNEHELQLHIAHKLNSHKIDQRCKQMLFIGPVLGLKLRHILQNIDHPLCNLINRYDWIFYPTLQAVTSYCYLHRFAKNIDKESAKAMGLEESAKSLDEKLNIIFNKDQKSWSKIFYSKFSKC
jgi:hypothetical protein